MAIIAQSPNGEQREFVAIMKAALLSNNKMVEQNTKSIIWVFPKILIPQNGWFVMENLMKMGWFGGKKTYFWKHPYPCWASRWFVFFWFFGWCWWIEMLMDRKRATNSETVHVSRCAFKFVEKLRGLGLLPNFCLLMNHVSVASFSENAPKRKTQYMYVYTYVT